MDSEFLTSAVFAIGFTCLPLDESQVQTAKDDIERTHKLGNRKGCGKDGKGLSDEKGHGKVERTRREWRGKGKPRILHSLGSSGGTESSSACKRA